jgi:hypothetical protein
MNAEGIRNFMITFLSERGEQPSKVCVECQNVVEKWIKAFSPGPNNATFNTLDLKDCYGQYGTSKGLVDKLVGWTQVQIQMTGKKS